jgi:hypothetical protein
LRHEREIGLEVVARLEVDGRQQTLTRTRQVLPGR